MNIQCQGVDVRKRVLAVLFPVILWTSCGRVPQTHYYALEYQLLSEPLVMSPLPVFIEKFAAYPLMDQDNLLYKTSPFEFKLDAYRRWVLPPHAMLTQEADAYFKQRKLFSEVLHKIPSDRACYLLTGRVMHFEEIDFGGQRTAFVSIWFETFNLKTETLVLSEIIEKKSQIQGDDAEAIIKAMSEATASVFDALAQALSSRFAQNP
jgi:ABC-type uncharacterized transport system auxiliary subunit